MRVVEIARPGGPEVLRIVEREVPRPGAGEVLVRIAAAGVNRPDIQQRRGLYPPPPGTTDIPGLDIAGIVHAAGPGVDDLAAGPGVDDLAVGAVVCALVNGGGYADFCVVPAVQCMPVPRGLSFVEAASLPEVFFTAWNNIVWLGRLGRGETLLVHGGTSGVGMAGIQIARQLFGARVLATAGGEEKRAVCLNAGAEAAFDYRGDWDVEIRYHLSGSGVDVILDGQAGPDTQRQLDLLNPDGRLVFIASHQGEFAEVNMRQLVRRRLTVTGSTLRPRAPDYKGRLARELVKRVWPLLEDGRIATRIHAALPFEQVQAAHAILDDNRQIGKVVLIVDPALGASVPHARHAA